MHVASLHPWDLTPTEAVALQRELRGRLVDGAMPSRVRYVAGVDVSGRKDDPMLTAGCVVWDREDGRVVESVSVREPEKFPYVPGLLSFREIPAISKVLEKLQTTPDVIVVDGQGRAHPRRLGIAAHLGLLVDVPTVGAGKSRLCGTYEEPGPEVGAASPLLHQEEVIGQVVRTKPKCKPLFLSAGNRIGLEEAVAVVLQCLRGYRLPEPTRLAHLFVNEARIGAQQASLL